MCGSLAESFLGYEGRDCFSVEGGAQVFVLVRIIILLNLSPATQNTSITLIKEDPFFFLKVMGLPTILNPDYVDS
jgi:hypothetical protein